MPGFLFSGVRTTLQVPGTTIQTVTDDAPTIDTSDLQSRLEELRELLGKDDPTDAIYACDRFNRDYPVSGQGWNIASHLALKINDADAAVRAIDRALTIDAERPEWLLQKANCLNVAGRNDEARSLAIRMAARLYPTAAMSSAVGLMLVQLELHAEAQLLFAEAIRLEPGTGGHYYNLATVQRFLGMLDESEGNLDKAIELDPTDVEALALRSGLRTQTEEQNHVQQLKAALNKQSLSPREEVAICHALAKELEDMTLYEESFSFLKRGADLRRKHINYDVEQDLQTMQEIESQFSKGLINSAGEGHVDAAPIFVFGMPRTGTTLVERILGSHSVVHAAGELNNFAIALTNIARATADGPLRSREDLIRATTKIDFAALGKAYIDSCNDKAAGNAHFVDKMPMNFLYAGLIHLALPKAKIVYLDRDPMDTCYAVYKTLFEGAYPYSYDLEELARYFAGYRTLMGHWERVIPGVMHCVSYEALVTDSKTQIQGLLDYCGLSWEEQCVDFHRAGGHSTTASAVQVRQPLYKSSVGKWKHFEQELLPVTAILKESHILE